MTPRQAFAQYREADGLLRPLETPPDAQRVLSLVLESSLSAYDCEFVSLAEEASIPLVTADRGTLSAFPNIAVSLNEYSGLN